MPNALQSDFWQTITPAIPIGRQAVYFEIPSFEIGGESHDTWVIVGVFNYAIEQNFTLVLPTKPTDPNYVACIKYRVDNVAYRYKLWENEGDEVYYPLYTGQLIKGNFQIEIWSQGESADSNDSLPIRVSIRRARTTIGDGLTYKNPSTDPEVVTDLKNTNLPVASTQEPPVEEDGEIQNTVVSSTSALFTQVECADGSVVFSVGNMRIKWIGGVYFDLLSGTWRLGTYDIVDLEDEDNIIVTIGNLTDYDTQAEALAAAIGFNTSFQITGGSGQLAIRNTRYNVGNTNGTTTPTFLVNPAIGLGLTYTDEQHGTNN